MSRLARALGPRSLGAVLVLGASTVLAACGTHAGSSPSATSSTTTPVPVSTAIGQTSGAKASGASSGAGVSTTSTTAPVPVTTTPATKTAPNGVGLPGIRSRFLADTEPSDTAFDAFTALFSKAISGKHLPTGATSAEAEAAERAAAALAVTRRQLDSLRSGAPKKIATDLVAVIVAEGSVRDGLLQLASQHTSPSFSFTAWGASFSKADQKLVSAVDVVDVDLGLPTSSTPSAASS